jgi:transposase
MKKRSIETYYELFYRWQRSGLSKAAFADREGISKVSFYSWCKKFETKTDSQDAPTGFTRIELAEATSQLAVARINYPSGISVELFGPLDPDRIKALIF